MLARPGTDDAHWIVTEAHRVNMTATVARSGAFLVNMILIDDLERFALQAGAAVEPSRIPGAGPDEYDVLRSPKGALEIQDWLIAYRHSIDLLRKFRNGLVHNQNDVTDDDVDAVTEGSARVLRGLVKRLAPS